MSKCGLKILVKYIETWNLRNDYMFYYQINANVKNTSWKKKMTKLFNTVILIYFLKSEKWGREEDGYKGRIKS